MTSLRQLEYLVALSETRHFRLAAEKAGVSQPTLSAQLQSMEQRLGVQLIERGRASVIFTHAGERILALARHIIASVREIQAIAQSEGREMSGMVKLGLPASIGPYLMSYFLPALHREYPALRFYIRENYPALLPDALASGVHDLLILPVPVRGDDFDTVRLFREPLYLAVPAEHALANHDVIDAKLLQGQPVLTLEKGHVLHEQVQSICDDVGARLLRDYEGTSLSTLHQMVATGLGFTFLPGLYARASRHSGIKLLTLRSKPLHRTIGLLWRRSSPLAETHRCIAGLLRKCVKQHYPDFMILD